MTIRKAVKTAIAAALVVMSFAGHAADGLLGTWRVSDSQGTPFEITLLADGKATSTLHPDQTDTWTEQGSAAVITWSTGWISRTGKADDHYMHAAYRRGQSPNTPPNHASDAEKMR